MEPLKTIDTGENILSEVTYSNTGDAPVSVADVKGWAKIDFSDDDNLIDELIDEVIDVVENELNLTITDKTVTATYESFASRIDLPFAPVDSITSVKTLDNDEETTLTATEDYYLQGNSLYLEDLYGYQNPYYKIGLEVVYDCSHGSLPNGILLGLKKAILSNYSDREDVAGGMSIVEMPNSSWKHLKRYKNY